MSARPVKSVTPFDFRSDFEAPDTTSTEDDDRISISVSELAALLEDTRRSTAEMLRDEQVQIQADAMRESATALKQALARIVDLVELLEKASLSEETREDALSRVRSIAAELIDGQGNLFQS
ncbi:hypothetical protein [Henriciella aquimarina]|uniref:hypothetical protein n=1 Tax=Henriciella aquimarina TaxID=545261 RepID=UPI000A05F4FE|nr:hypothetical protein [Henriciella aquimarina]